MTGARSRIVVAGFALFLIHAAPAGAAQDAPTSTPPPVVSQATLARIRVALASDPALAINAALTPTFYAQADGTIPTFSAYLKGWVPARGSGGRGIDLLQLVRDGLRNLQQAQRERETRQIRARIDRELATLYGVK